MSSERHLTGRLEEGPHGLLLHVGGGVWKLDANRSARRLIGCDVEVAGHRAGFNGLICDQIWRVGQPRPHQAKFNIEYLLVGGLVGYGLVAVLRDLARYLS